MALNARNFITFILIVFYSVLNSDNAYGSLTEQDCQNGLREYCGEALSDILECAKQAVMMYQRRASDDEVIALRQQRDEWRRQGFYASSYYTGLISNEIQRAFINAINDGPEDSEGYNRPDTPDFVHEYFDINVIPYVSKENSVSPFDFCRSDELFRDPAFLAFDVKVTGYDETSAILAIIGICDAQISYLKAQPIAYYIFKNHEFTHYTLEQIYLKHFARNLILINVPPRGLKTPEEYCERFRQ